MRRRFFIDNLRLPALLTYGGITLACIGILATFYNASLLACICLFGAGWCDLFDGSFARRFKRDEEGMRFGMAIDSLADVLSFAVLPCCIFLALKPPLLLALLTVPYIICAITRLAVFDARAQIDTVVTHYQGLPTTFAALIFPVTWLASFILNMDAFIWVYATVMVVMALLFVLNIRVRKP